MQSKISVVLLKSKSINNNSDLNKMGVHLEQILAEKSGVDLKSRQTLTDPTIKNSDFIVFLGYDAGSLSEFFKAVSVSETLESAEDRPTLFIYDEPGESVHDYLDRILQYGADRKRIDPKIFNKVVSTWSYRDIIGTIDISIRKLGTNSASLPSPEVNGGDASEDT